jgi:hypothetical protein
VPIFFHRHDVNAAKTKAVRADGFLNPHRIFSCALSGATNSALTSRAQVGNADGQYNTNAPRMARRIYQRYNPPPTRSASFCSRASPAAGNESNHGERRHFAPKGNEVYMLPCKVKLLGAAYDVVA